MDSRHPAPDAENSWLTPEEQATLRAGLLRKLTPEERLRGLSPEDILRAMYPKQIKAWLKQTGHSGD